MKDLGTCIELINSSTTQDEAFQRFTAIMSRYGYDRIAYSLITDHPSLGLAKQHGLATSYPLHWMKYYQEKKYLKRDPVVLGILKSRTPFFWADLKKDPSIPESSFEILDQGFESGVKDGLAIPLLGQPGEVVGLGLARKDSEKGRDYRFMSDAFLLSTFFHEKFRSLIKKPRVVSLSPKESEILLWAAEGKTDPEIAGITGSAVSTIRWHWRNIFRKLDANSRLYCVTKAIMLGMIAPGKIMSTPPTNR